MSNGGGKSMESEGQEPKAADRVGRQLRVPIIGIFVLLLIQSLVWASDFLVPVTAACLGYFVLNRPRRALAKLGVPPAVSAALFTVAIAAMISVLLVQLSAPTAAFINDLPSLIEQIKQKLSAAGGTLEAINDAAVAAEELVDEQDAETVEVEVVSDNGIAAAIFSMAPGFLSRILFALILLFFLVASGDLFLTKAVQSFNRFRDKREAVEVVHAIEDRLGYYLGGITIINAGLGIAVAIAMFLWGLPNAVLFGFMAFGLNYVPFLGGLIGATVAAAVAFVSVDGSWVALGVFATYVALTSVEGQFVTPLLISKRMRLNTPVVFLFVAFFAWIWSIIGMIVALPILIMLKIVAEETKSMQTFARFLGDNEDQPASKRDRSSSRQ